jgi:predicted porin
MKRGLVVLSVVGLVFASVASASVQQGDTELDFLGGFLTQNGKDGAADIDALFVSAALGYFFTDNIQGQVVAMGAWTEAGGVDNDIYGFGVRGKYHFMPTNQWVPYVGAQLLWVEVDAEGGADGDGMLWGPVLGLRYELNANNDFFVEYQYHMWEGDAGDAIDDGHGLFVGLIHQFK